MVWLRTRRHTSDISNDELPASITILKDGSCPDGTDEGRAAFEKYSRDLEAWQNASAALGFPVERPLRRPELPGIAGQWRGPSQSFNGKIAPVVSYAIRGSLWCQGESNSGDGRIYAARMEALVQGWREAWGLPHMPFYFTQLQAYGAADSAEVGLADIRQVQDEGVVFKSHIDGSSHTFTPESVMDTEQKLGADIAMCLDECLPYPATRDQARTPGCIHSVWAVAEPMPTMLQSTPTAIHTPPFAFMVVSSRSPRGGTAVRSREAIAPMPALRQSCSSTAWCGPLTTSCSTATSWASFHLWAAARPRGTAAATAPPNGG